MKIIEVEVCHIEECENCGYAIEVWTNITFEEGTEKITNVVSLTALENDDVVASLFELVQKEFEKSK